MVSEMRLINNKNQKHSLYETLCVTKKEKPNIMLLLGWGFFLPMKKSEGVLS